MQCPIEIPGWQIEAEIGRGARSLVYRATRGAEIVAVKVPSDGDGGAELKREAAHLARLHHPSLASILAVDSAAGRPYVVMEYVEGITLEATLSRAERMSEPRIRAIATHLAGALAEVHRYGLVHRDVKPANVILTDDGRAKLIDFGFVTRRSPVSPAARGTPAYSAPEQAGLLARPVDGRADLYALGVVLYECAAGAPPFTGTEVSAVLQAHLTSTPADLAAARSDLSSDLVQLIHSLLSKEPGDRPANAREVLWSLGASAPDTARGLRGSLFGRGEEFAILRRHYKRAMKGDGTAVLIQGAPGSGKTRLASELLEGVSTVGGLVLEVRCEDERSAPFSGLRRAVDKHLTELVAAAEDAGETPAAVISPLAGDTGELLSAFSEVVAAHCDAPKTQPHERVFLDAIVDLMARIIEPHPVAVLFVDDAQWLDPGTREVLARLADRVADLPMLILVNARNDTASSDAVRRLTGALGPTALTRIELAPLSSAAVRALLEFHLGGGELDPEALPRIIARTGGNPFSIEVHVHAMLDAGALRPSWGQWRLDVDGLDVLELPSDVDALVVYRLDAVPVSARAALELAAVIGRRFELALVCDALSIESDAAHAAVDAAVSAHLIRRISGARYAFIHDRVREAILGSLIADRTKELHRRVAAVLEQRTDRGRDGIYALAIHAALGDPEANPRRCYTSSLDAGLLAFDERGYHECIAFLERAWEVGRTAGIDVEARIAERLGDAYARLGRTEDAIIRYERCLEMGSEALVKADLQGRGALARTANGDSGAAWLDVEAAFDALGHRLPKSGPGRWMSTAWDVLLGLSAMRGREGEGNGDERDRVLARLYEIGTLVAFYNLDDQNLAQMTLRPLRAALRFGPSRELVNAYVNYAYAASHQGWTKTSARFFDRAVALAKSIDEPSELARTLHVRASATGARGDVLLASELHEEALVKYERSLEPLYYLNGCVELAWILLLRGYAADAWIWIDRGLRTMRRSSRARGVLDGHPIHAYAAAALASIGRITEAQVHLRMCRTAADRAKGEKYRWAELLAHALVVQTARGELGEDVDSIIERHGELAPRPDRLPVSLRHFYVFAAQARLAQCRNDVQEGTEPRTGALARAAFELRIAASIPLLEAHSALIDGALARLRGDPAMAGRKLAVAEDLARRVDCSWVLADSAWERAELLLAEAHPTAAAHLARTAYDQFRACGRAGRARRIVERFGLQVEREQTSSVTSVSVDFQRHLAALLRVSLASATELDPDKQARAALDEVVALLRAERAYLFLTKPGGGELALKVGRDASGEELRSVEPYSRTVVERVRASREPVIVSGSADGVVLGSQSAVTHGLRSIAAAPLMLHERLMGVLYLDTRVASGLFTEADLDILMAIGNHIAIAMETVRSARFGTYARIASNVPGMVFQLVRDGDGRWTSPYVSDGCRDLLDVEPDAILGDAENLFACLHTEDRADMLRSLDTSARKQSAWRWEGRAVVDGTDRWLQGAARPEPQAGGGVLWDGLLMDITTRRRAEDALVRQARELERSNEDLEQFAYAASHDLQEPLRVVASYLQLLSKRYQGQLDEEADEFIGFAVDGARRMRTMIKALLDFSRVGTHGKNFKPTDLEGVFDAAVANLAASIAESNAEVSRGPLPTLDGDQNQLLQLFQNLIGNAIKFRGEAPPKIRVAAERDGEGWRVSVADNGIGIDAAYVDRIFGIFQRLHTHDEYPGTGVGLAICKKIVERHGGDITVTSQGAGTTFHFTLQPEDNDDSDWRVSTVIERL